MKESREPRFVFVNCEAEFDPTDAYLLRERLFNSTRGEETGHFEINVREKPSHDRIYSLSSAANGDIVSRLSSEFPTLEDAGISLGIGIATGCDKVYITEDRELVEESRLLPLFFMRDYRQGRVNQKKFLVNPWNDDGTLVNLDDFPKLKRYFYAHKGSLQKRHVAKRNPDSWFRTIDKLRSGLIEKELLLLPDMCKESFPVLSVGKYPHHNCYWLASEKWDMRILGGLLMSDIVKNFIEAVTLKMQGGTLRFQAQFLRMLRIPSMEMLSPEVRQSLKEAFLENDRDKANKIARIANRLNQ